MNWLKRSNRWATFIFIMVVVGALVKFLIAFAQNDVGHYIAMALMFLLGGIILLVVPAYFIGMLVDKFKKDRLHSQDDSHSHEAPKVKQSKNVEIARDGHFIAYRNGTVLDTKTNLLWAAKDCGADLNWQCAKEYCENYRGGGYTDWRMPTQNELEGLYDETQAGLYKVTKLICLTGLSCWSSETSGSEAGGFDFRTGNKPWRAQRHTVIDRALPARNYHKEGLIKQAADP